MQKDLKKIRRWKGFVGDVINYRKNEKFTLDPVLTIFVEKKLSEAQCKKERRKIIPKAIGGVGTDVVEMEMPVADDMDNTWIHTPQKLNTRVDHSKPVYPGCSASNIKGTAGTHGEFFRDEPFEDKFYGGLNVHVGFERVDMDISEQDRTIVKPGPADGGTRDDKIGDLTTGTRINLNGGTNTRDSCLFEYDDNDDVNPDVPGYGVVEGVSEIVIGEYGLKPPCRSLGERTGKKLYKDAAIRVRYKNGVGTLTGCNVWESMSIGGTSGATIRTPDKRFATDTIFAGSGTHTISIPFMQNWKVYGKELVTKGWWENYLDDDRPDDPPDDDGMPNMNLNDGLIGVAFSLIMIGAYLIGKGDVPVGAGLIILGILVGAVAVFLKANDDKSEPETKDWQTPPQTSTY